MLCSMPCWESNTVQLTSRALAADDSCDRPLGLTRFDARTGQIHRSYGAPKPLPDLPALKPNGADVLRMVTAALQPLFKRMNAPYRERIAGFAMASIPGSVR